MYIIHRTLYITPKGYTKHYYAESERIASRIGGGGLQDLHKGFETYPDMVSSHKESSANLFGKVMDCLDADVLPQEDALKYLYEWLEFVEEEKDCYWYHPDHLGSSSWITYTDGSAVQHLHYLPWGEDFVDQRQNSFDGARFTFSAKERDPETGYSYFGSRYYNSDLSIWLSVDPMSDKYPSLSPYTYCANNPVKLVDPNGEEVSPIYDTHGNFLGTDDEGLTGKAIVMKKEKFKQGMSHADALSYNLGKKGLVDEIAFNKLSDHYSGLKKRPDYDGYLTKSEADAWWRNKSGQPLYVDQSKIELPGITTQSFVDKEDNCFYENFLGSSSNTGKVYGTLKLTLIDASTGEVHIGGRNYMDKYDFKMDGRPFRDFATWAGRPGGKNDGKDFLIYGYGHAIVPVVTPKNRR